MVDFSDFIHYLIKTEGDTSDRQVPSLSELSQSLGINVAKLREQLEVARVLGLVDVRPRTGIKRLPYQFRPAVIHSVSYAVCIDRHYFETFSDFRKHIESAYWFDATSKLNSNDIEELRILLVAADNKLRREPIQIPHREHRDLHLGIYKKLDNPFVTGILETYWEIYQSVGLDLYTDLAYLERVWAYHKKIIEALSTGNPEQGYHYLVEHMGLLNTRNQSSPSQLFE